MSETEKEAQGTTQAHTAGPWTVGYNENETRSVMTAWGQVIAFPVIPDINPYHVALDIAAANARLIAAAPDLLFWAKRLIAVAQEDRPEDWAVAVYGLEGVVAKAEGR